MPDIKSVPQSLALRGLILLLLSALTSGTLAMSNEKDYRDDHEGYSAAQNQSFAGVWDTVAGGSYKYTLTLEQKGEQITGSYTPGNGKVEGTLEGNVLRLRWTQDPDLKGTARLVFSKDGQSFTGMISTGDDPDVGGHSWNGTRHVSMSCSEYFVKVQSAKLATRHDFEILYMVKSDGSLWWQRDDIGLGPPGEHWMNGQPCRVEELVSHSLSEAKQVMSSSSMGGGDHLADIFPGGDGTFYLELNDGDLYWYRHVGYQDGTDQWATGNGAKVGTGWNTSTKVIAMGKGVLYSIIQTPGPLRWNRHENYLTGEDFYAGWTQPAVSVAGFVTEYKNVFGGTQGVFYGVNAKGELVWFRHKTWLNPVEKSGPTVLQDWDGGRTVATGWNEFTKIFSAGHGHIYALLPSGELRAFDHIGWQDGTPKWGQEVSLGTGWGEYKFIFAAMRN